LARTVCVAGHDWLIEESSASGPNGRNQGQRRPGRPSPQLLQPGDVVVGVGPGRLIVKAVGARATSSVLAAPSADIDDWPATTLRPATRRSPRCGHRRRRDVSTAVAQRRPSRPRRTDLLGRPPRAGARPGVHVGAARGRRHSSCGVTMASSIALPSAMRLRASGDLLICAEPGQGPSPRGGRAICQRRPGRRSVRARRQHRPLGSPQHRCRAPFGCGRLPGDDRPLLAARLVGTFAGRMTSNSWWRWPAAAALRIRNIAPGRGGHRTPAARA